MKKIILLSCILILLPLSVFAATINVPGDQSTIQAGIDAAVDGDIVLLAGGTYTGVGNYDVNFSGKSITLKSANRPDCIIDCQQNGRGFSLDSGETVTFEGLTVKNGDAGDSEGGGIYANGSGIIIVDCVFDGNSASSGGAVNSSNYSSSSFTNCTFTANSASSGGAVYSSASSSSFTNCTFTANSASSGGAVNSYSYYSSSSFANCTFTANSASSKGGAVYSYYYSSSFSSFTNCTFTANSASSEGGVVYSSSYDSSSFSSFINCTFTANNASSGGAVYYFSYDSASSFINCTFATNSASSQGGVIWCNIPLDQEVPITLKNCILWDNTAPEGAEIHEQEPLIITYSNIQGDHAGTGNIDVDPLFVNTDNDFHLQYNSPCIDTGTDDGAPADDLDGYLRPIGTGYDMGAYEYHYDTLTWKGYSSSWNDSQNWQPSMVPVEFNSVVILGLLGEVTWPTVDELNSVAAKILIESGTLTIEQGKLSIGGS